MKLLLLVLPESSKLRGMTRLVLGGVGSLFAADQEDVCRVLVVIQAKQDV